MQNANNLKAIGAVIVLLIIFSSFRNAQESSTLVANVITEFLNAIIRVLTLIFT